MRFPVNQKKVRPILFGACLAVVFVCIVNPLGIASGNHDVDSYTEIRSLLSETKKSKLLYLSSDSDFFEFKGTSQLRKNYSANFALEGVSEVLSAASFGNWSFNKYLNDNEITHVLVPWNSAQRNRVVRKWGVHGNITIDLKPPFFMRQTVTSGEFPVALYKVVRTGESVWQTNDYKLKWDPSTREDFYLQRESMQEVGLYAYEYQSNFRDGSSVSWVMADDLGVAESPAFEIETSTRENVEFLVTMEFVAAYGSYAPTQVVTVSSSSWTKSVMVSSNRPGRIAFNLTPGEHIRFGNALPCRSASSFDPGSSDARRFCYGISKITVRPAQVK